MSFGGRKVTADGRGQADFDALPKHVVDVLTKAKLNWLKNTEILEILRKYQRFGFQVSGQAPFRPPSQLLQHMRAVRSAVRVPEEIALMQ